MLGPSVKMLRTLLCRIRGTKFGYFSASLPVDLTFLNASTRLFLEGRLDGPAPGTKTSRKLLTGSLNTLILPSISFAHDNLFTSLVWRICEYRVSPDPPFFVPGVPCKNISVAITGV